MNASVARSLSSLTLVVLIAGTVLAILFWSGLLLLFPTSATGGFIIFDAFLATIATLSFAGLFVAKIFRGGTVSRFSARSPVVWSVLVTLGANLFFDVVSAGLTFYYLVAIILLGVGLAVESSDPPLSCVLVFETVIAFFLLVVGFTARAVWVWTSALLAQAQINRMDT